MAFVITIVLILGTRRVVGCDAGTAHPRDVEAAWRKAFLRRPDGKGPCSESGESSFQFFGNSELVSMSDTFNYSVGEVLRDGTRILIRAIRPDDKPLLLNHFHSLSERSIYYRFFGHKRSLEPADLHELTELDFLNHVGLAATVEAEGGERFIGVGRYLRSRDTTEAEVAFAVLDEFQGRGVGTLLLHHLASIARQRGVKKFAAFVMGDNHQMLEVFANSGFRTRDSYEAGTVRVTLDLADSPPDHGGQT